MQFSTKDLLVTVLPRSDKELNKFCLLRTVICRSPTLNCLQASCFGISNCGSCSKFITCGVCSTFGTFGCGFLRSCGPGASACDPTIFCPGGSSDPFVLQNLEDLVSLRTELQTALKNLDVIQKEGLPSGFGSKAQVEEVERGLSEALEQVRVAKKSL
jgi:hypothetical protein